jgi:hypothetical protein
VTCEEHLTANGNGISPKNPVIVSVPGSNYIRMMGTYLISLRVNSPIVDDKQLIVPVQGLLRSPVLNTSDSRSTPYLMQKEKLST